MLTLEQLYELLIVNEELIKVEMTKREVTKRVHELTIHRFELYKSIIELLEVRVGRNEIGRKAA